MTFMQQVGVKARNYNAIDMDTAPNIVTSNSVQSIVKPPERSFQVVTLLPVDAIPVIDDPSLYSVAEENTGHETGELVLGVTNNGESKT